MSPTRSHALALGVLCAAGGAGAGAIASATASTGHSSTPKAAHHATAGHGTSAKHGRLRELREVARHSVSGNVTVDTKAGFQTISFERGTVDTVSGDQITITEGGPRATQRQETITVPATAHVRDDGKPASLSTVSAGQRVLVLTLPKRTLVVARTPGHAAS